MDESKSLGLQKQKEEVDLFHQMSKNFKDMYEGKGSFMEYAKSKEEEITKIKDDIFSLIYGPGYKENLNNLKKNKKSPKKQMQKPKINIPTQFNLNLNNTPTTSKNARNEENKLTSECESGTHKTDNSQSKPTSKEKRSNQNLISFMKENIKLKQQAGNEESVSPARKRQINNLNASFKNNDSNILNNSKSYATNGFSTTKSNNLSLIKKQFLSPIKEAPVKLNPPKLKLVWPKLSNESAKNFRNKSYSKIVLNPITDQSTITSYNNSNNNNKSVIGIYNNLNLNFNNNNNYKIQNENSIIAEEPIKTKESDIFRMTQYDEKQDTKNIFKKNASTNANNVSMNTNTIVTERGANETQVKIFSKLNSDKNINNNNNTINTNITMKKLEINTQKHIINNMIDTSSTGENNNSFFSPDASTKYISINQSTIINSNFNNITNHINNDFSSANILINNNNNNNDKTISNKFNSNVGEIDSLQRNSNSSQKYPEYSEKGRELIEKIEQKVLGKKEEKYPLIPNLKKNLKFKDSNPLKTLFFNCSDNLNITNKLFNHIGNEKNKKLKSKTIEKLKKKEREFYVEKDLNLDMSFKDKVFVYGENGGYYLSADFGHMQKYNLISKISDNMAMNNRNYLTKQFDYDYKADEDYIYQNELREKYLKNKKEELGKEQVLNDWKHKKVDDYLDYTLKKSEILMQRIDNNLLKYENEKNRYADEKINKAGNGDKNKEGKSKTSSLPKKRKTNEVEGFF